jgi:electron transport complex protein RnfG
MTGHAETAGKLAQPSTWQMYRAMVGVGIFCGLLIVTVFELTKPIIERNKAEALRKAIFQVLPEARSSATFQLTDGDRFERLPDAKAAEGARLVHAGYDDEKRLIGLAVEAQGMGYQDVIRVIYGYSFAQDAVTGIRVLETKETPGLGTKIETDPTFLENFKQLDVMLTDDRSALANPIEFVKPGRKEHRWQIDGITGATISSNAMASILSGSTAWWIPRIRAHLDDFEN